MTTNSIEAPKITILIPHYKTLQLTKLCLRLIRKHTADLKQVRVIVIDNDSQDESLPYLRGLSWITLIERKAESGETPVAAHARALDLALANVTTPYVLSIHTDTLVKHRDWLNFLLQQFMSEDGANIAGVGSWKLETKPYWRCWLKNLEYYVQWYFYRLIGKTEHALGGVGKNYYYLRSHCAIYRMDVIRKLNLHFADGDMVAGKHMHQAMVDAGYQMIFLPSELLSKYVEHINHATTVLNPELSSRERSVRKGLRRIERSLARMRAQEVLQDATLDG